MDANDGQRATRSRSGSKKHQWTPKQDALLVDCMLDLKNDPYWSAGEGNNFKPGFLMQLERMLKAKSPGCGLKAQPHIYSRHKLLKTQFNAISDMLNQSSRFKWNSASRCVTCEDEAWDQWVKIHPRAAGLRDKPFPHLESLSIIFGKHRATGQRAVNPTNPAVDILNDTVNLDEFQLKSRENLENNTPAPRPTVNNIQDQSNSSVQSQSTSKKRKASTEKEVMGSLVDSMNKIGALCESTSQGIRDLASCFQNITNHFTEMSAESGHPQNVYEELLAIEGLGLDESQMVEVGEIIATNPSTSRFFFSLPMSAKKIFVQKKLGLV